MTTLADYENYYENTSSLKFFKKACEIINEAFVKPLLDVCVNHQNKLKEENKKEENDPYEKEIKEPEILAKWWVNYLSILQETYNQKKDCVGWKEHPLQTWFPLTERNLLKESIKGLEQHNHWTMVLFRGCCAKKDLLSKLVPDFIIDYDEYMKKYRKYVLSYAIKEVDAIKKSIKIDEKLFKYRRNLLEEIIKIIEKEDSEKNELEIASLLSGYLGRKKFPNLKHSVIIGDDGGLYALVNSIDNYEIKMLLQTGEIQ